MTKSFEGDESFMFYEIKVMKMSESDENLVRRIPINSNFRSTRF